MRKILSMMMAVVLSVTIANAETTRLYCKVSQGWWKADGAAVAIFAWTDGGTNNGAWPGVRMTAVEGETDMWYGDVDPAVHNKLIFVRVNGSGDISDWGAKTADLTFPTDGKNLYTITSETPVWGDPGVTGEWSVKGEAQGGDDPEPETGCNWDNLEWLGDGAGGGKYSNMFKVCLPEGWGVVNVQSPGFATKPGIYVTVPAGISACSLGEGNYDVQGAGIILHVDAFTQEETEVSIIHGTGEGTLTVYRKPSYYIVGDAQALGAWTPANGVKVFGDSVNFTLAAGTYKLKVVNGPSWEGTTALGYNALKEGQTGLSTDNDNNIVFTLAAEGAVAIKVENNKVIVDLPASQGGDEPEPQPTIHYYLVGSMQGWSLENAIPMPGDSLFIEDAAAGAYALKILPQNTGWENALTFANVNADCSSEGITEGDQGNIEATLAQNGPVKIKVVNGEICITGNFGGEVPITSYTVVGDSALLGENWNLNSTVTNMVEQDDHSWKYTIDSVVLAVNQNYKYKMVANHSWDIAQYPQNGDYILTVTAAGTYKVEFTLVPGEVGGSAVATLLHGEPEPEPQPTINYYLVGSMQGWSLENAIPLPGDSLVIEDAAAGNYAFKLLPQTTGWDNALTYSNVNAECSSAGITEGENGNIVVTLAQAGPVKIKVVNGQLCITGNFEVPVTYNYYLVGSMQSWSLENAIPMPGDSVVVTWAANVYNFKVLPQNTGWANEMGYSAVNAECSSEGIQDGGGGNIKITLAAETEVKIKVVNGQLCITGNFGGQVEITSYTVVGDPLLIAAGWETTSTATDMIAQQDGSWTYTLSSVDLETGHNYKYKMVANHSWDVAQYPQSGDYILTVDVNGIYDVVFTLVPGEVGGSAVATLRQHTDLMNSVPLPSVMKVIKDGKLYILVNGQIYTVMGQIVK